MGVAVDGDVRDRVTAADEELPRREVAVEEPQHLDRALLAPDRLGVGRLQASDQQTEAQAAHRRDDVRLLEEEPAHDLSPLERVVGQVGRALGEVEQDRVRLGQEAAVVGLEHRRRPGRIDRRVLAGQRVAVEDVDLDALVRETEVRQEQPHLVAVAGGGVVVETQVGEETSSAREV